MNYKSKEIEVHNRSTHDEEKRTIKLHKIDLFVNDKLWKTVDELDGERMVENEAERAEKELKEHIEFIANNTPEKPFTERLKDKGFH
jgi:hypothetical protein